MLQKAGEPGWGVIPIINIYFIVKLAGRPLWWISLIFVPLVNIFVGILLHTDIAKKFGTGIGFGLELTFLPIIFYPLIGFGNYQYQDGNSGGPGDPGGHSTLQ